MRIGFTATITKFAQQGEKTGWNYIEVPKKVSEKLAPGVKKSYRVKGKLDDYPIERVAMIPMGEGQFIISINAAMRKGTGKRFGQKINVELELDKTVAAICADLLACLADDPAACNAFNKMPPSHQQYYSKWIESAKTDGTKTKRIAMAVNALARNIDFGAMLREQRDMKL
ncbi:MAG: hypothetical protein JWQ27_3040 [Ferruginibacter sp.]|nr:hypothetical protein [Ferruginibacter sp.]